MFENLKLWFFGFDGLRKRTAERLTQVTHLRDELYEVRKQYRVSRDEWVKERRVLLDEVDGLKTELRDEVDDCKIITERLQSELDSVRQDLAKTESRLEVRDLEVKELTLLIAKYHTVQDREMAINCMKTEYAKQGGVPHGRHIVLE